MREIEDNVEKELVQILSESFVASIKNLNSILNQEIEAIFENAAIVDDIDTVPEILENIVILKNTSKLGELYTVLPSSCATPLAELMMTGDTDGASAEVGSLKTNAIKEIFSQLMDIYSSEMSKAIFQNIAFKVTSSDFSKDLTTSKKLMPKISKSAVILNYKVTFSRITKDVIRQTIPLELFTELLELIKPDISTDEDLLAMHDPALNPELNPNYSGVDDSVMVQPVQFPSFDDQTSLQLEDNKNFNLLLDIKLKLTVELGRAELPVKRVLELTRGSIIELDKIAGEPVELYANDKLIARGEVVVIEDNFGLRITNIISPDDRIKNL